MLKRSYLFLILFLISIGALIYGGYTLYALEASYIDLLKESRMAQGILAGTGGMLMLIFSVFVYWLFKPEFDPRLYAEQKKQAQAAERQAAAMEKLIERK